MGERQRLLVVGDEKSLRDQYKRFLEADFDVGVVGSTAQAIKRLRTGAFDLVIADESTSDADGFELLGTLRDLEMRVPVIILTAIRDNMKVLRAEELGALCLAKPIEQAALTEAVHLRIAPRQRSMPVAMPSLETVTATFAKKEFRRVLETATQKGRVLITKYQDPRAVLMSFDEYQKLTSAREPVLEQLAGEFDELLARMQTPAARVGTQALFSMSSEDLGHAAVDAAKKSD